MRGDKPSLKDMPRRLDASSWIVGAVAFCSLVIFAVLGVKVLPASLALTPSAGVAPHIPTAPFLLSIALVLLAWRRSTELKKAAFEREEAEKHAHSLAYKDDVTGLFNRRFLVERLGSVDSKAPYTLIILDVDHFKKVNDLYGHAAGDELLLELSARMQDTAPVGACCVRLGGDEFAILLTGPSASHDEASSFAECLIGQLNKPVQLDASVAHVGASVGISTLAPRQGTAEQLLRQSDIAMYEAKRLGRNCCVWFDSEMEQELNQRNLLEAEIRAGIVEGQFVPYFQPMLELSSGQVNGFEVLARWNHPTKGLVEPDSFIPVAEATGMISELSFAVMRTALLRTVSWPNHLTIAVNISPVQFKDPLLAQQIIKVLTETGFPAQRLELEITEGAILEDRGLALATIESLKNYGVRISLDDFGTGYASLSQLRELPFDRIKIDRSFVATLLDDKQSNAIVHAIATLGKNLDLPITAEGVETAGIQERLEELGCSDAQGWLFGRAVSGEEAAETFFDLPAGNEPQGTPQDVHLPVADRRYLGRRAAG